MPLPKIKQPLFELTLPSTGKKYKYRPFTVKEEKILLIAQESNDPDQMVLAIKQIIGNCVDKIDVDSMTMFDMEYVLIHIRGKSVSNEIEIKIKDPDTQEEINLNLDLNDVMVKRYDNHKTLIELGDDIYLKMRYPKIEEVMSKLNTASITTESLFEVMLSCIESVVEGEQVFTLKDFTKEEVDEFIESLSTTQLEEIKIFFDTMPTVRLEKKYKNKEGTEKTYVVEGMESFFT